MTIKRKKRTANDIGPVATSVRLPPALVDRLDSLARLLTKTGSPLAMTSAGGELTRADVLRLALIRGVEAIESEADPATADRALLAYTFAAANPEGGGR